jgi:multidrug efflux pump
MHGLINWATTRTRMIFALALLSIGAGVLAYTGLPKEGAPNIDVPILYVSVGLPGASAGDVERLVIKPLETELRDLEGLKQMTAYASEGHGGILMEFDFDWDKAATVADTRDRVDRAKADLPSDANEPTVNEVNLSAFPILFVSLSGDAPERTLLRVAKDLQREIEALAPVLEAPLAGHREEMVEVLVDPLKLEAYDVTAAELIHVVSRNNQLVAAGALQSKTGKFSVSVPGSFETASEVNALPIRSRGDRVVTLGELAEIRRTFEDAKGRARFNGQPTIALQVKKRTGENIIETSERVRQTVAQVVAQWPEPLRQAVQVNFSLDLSKQVVSMVSQLESSVMTAVLLVMIVVVAALGLRSALLVGLAVPCSFLLAFALLAALDMSISNMVMFGLILAVGMLVDGAIVVAEFADRRMSEGMPPRSAYAEAAKRMFWPIVSSTATTLCAFLPMLLWPGMPGQFMSLLPITLIFVLSASLLVALIYLPVIGGVLGLIIVGVGQFFRRLLRLKPKPPAQAAPFDGEPRTWFGWFMKRVVVGNPIGPFLTIALGVAALVCAGMLYGQYGKGVEFFVKTEPERAIVYVRARGNLSINEQDRLVREVEKRIAEVDGVAAMSAFSGEGGLNVQGGEGPPDAIGQIQLELESWETRFARNLKGDQVLADIEARLANIPGVFAELTQQKEGPQQGKPIQLEVASNDHAYLEKITALARDTFEQTEGLLNIDDTRPLPGIEFKLDVDRTAAGRFGADVAQIGAMVQLLTRGITLDSVTPDDSDDEIDIIARFPESARTLTTMETLKMRTNTGLVPLSNFTSLSAEPKVGQISRRDGVRFYLVRSEVVDGVNVNDKIAEIGEKMAEIGRSLPELAGRGSIKFVGDQEEQAESMAFLVQAFMGALGMMFVILLAQFNSIYNAVLVLSAVVMSVAGVLLGMVVMDQTFSIIMTGTGIVALAGIVVNNNIVLIDAYQEYAQKLPRIAAIIRTAEDRLRPVFLTTITTIAGLLPMVFATSIDFANGVISVGAPTALWWVQLATAVVFGLGFSTILTLVVTPAALAARVWFTRGMLWLAGMRRKKDGVSPPGEIAQPLKVAAE